MTACELEAARRLLFFSPPEAATLISGTSEQAWRRWEAGTRSIPDDVVDRIRYLLDWRQGSIDAAIRQIGADADGGRVALVWYDTLAAYESLAGREAAFFRPHQSANAALAAEFPGRVSLVRFDGPTHSAWLDGREDSERTRGMWAKETANLSDENK